VAAFRPHPASQDTGLDHVHDFGSIQIIVMGFTAANRFFCHFLSRRALNYDPKDARFFVFMEPPPMTTPSQDFERLQLKVSTEVREHWKAFLFEGILLAVLGLAAIVVPTLASLAVTIFLGWLFLIGGIGGLMITFWAPRIPGFWWSLLSAALALLVGVLLVIQPVRGMLTLTIVVGAYFLAEGAVTIMYALEHRRELSQRWGWLLTAGLMDIIVAFVIIVGLPGTAAWAIGLLVGLNMMFGGTTLIGMALAARNKS
jgi:uncharacterized membrane protein HdeD (DUF308 family)